VIRYRIYPGIANLHLGQNPRLCNRTCFLQLPDFVAKCNESAEAMRVQPLAAGSGRASSWSIKYESLQACSLKKHSKSFLDIFVHSYIFSSLTLSLNKPLWFVQCSHRFYPGRTLFENFPSCTPSYRNAAHVRTHNPVGY
jgi:hypothetical protein